jgi:hypothetical protein
MVPEGVKSAYGVAVSASPGRVNSGIHAVVARLGAGLPVPADAIDNLAVAPTEPELKHSC